MLPVRSTLPAKGAFGPIWVAKDKLKTIATKTQLLCVIVCCRQLPLILAKSQLTSP